MALSGIGIPIAPLLAYGLGPQRAKHADEHQDKRRRNEQESDRPHDDKEHEGAPHDAGLGALIDRSV